MNHAVHLLVTLFKVVVHPSSLVHLICCVLFLSSVLKCFVHLFLIKTLMYNAQGCVITLC